MVSLKKIYIPKKRLTTSLSLFFKRPELASARTKDAYAQIYRFKLSDKTH